MIFKLTVLSIPDSFLSPERVQRGHSISERNLKKKFGQKIRIRSDCQLKYELLSWSPQDFMNFRSQILKFHEF